MYEVIASEVLNEDRKKVGVGCFNDFSDTISSRMIGPLRGIFLKLWGAKVSRWKYSPTNSLPGEVAYLAKAMEAYFQAQRPLLTPLSWGD